jgi:Spy/CpxP family protein refolding chaperone
MRMIGIILVAGFGLGSIAAESPYAGMEQREIKALAPEDVTRLLAGEGMGFAKAAELNSYPGPKHVLELREQLVLTEEQATRTQVAFDVMHGKARRLGESLVEAERALDALFAGGNADEERLRAVVTRIAGIRGELRLAHLDAHLRMREILSPEQIAAYDRLRGYADEQGKSGGPGCEAHQPGHS